MSTNETIDEQTDAPDPIAEAILHGGAPPRDDPTETTDEQIVEQPVESEPELILGKFKSPDDLAEAYKNLESQFTQNNQRLADLESLLQEEDDEPAAQPWGASFNNAEPNNEEELIGWAERSPGEAAQWAIANADRVPKETVDAIWEHWFERKPTEAMAWYTEQQTLQVRQQYEAELEALREQVAPLRDAQTQSMFEGALTGLESQIPDLADYSQKIQEYVDNIPVDQLHLAFFPNGMDTPEKIQEGVKSLYAIVRMREAPTQQQAVPQAPQPSAFTQSRQGVADTGPVDYDAAINAAILNA